MTADDSEEVYALDIETTGLSIVDDKIIGLSICNGESLSSAVWYGEGEIEKVLQWLSEYEVPVIAWNALFDIGKLAHDYPQYPLNLVCDVAVYAQMCDNSFTTPGFGLKNSVRKYLGYETNETEIVDYLVSIDIDADSSNFREYLDRVPVSLIAKYCRYDTYYTYCLYRLLPTYIKCDPGTWSELFKSEVMAAVEARIEGFEINWDRLNRFNEESADKLQRVKETFLNDPEIAQYIRYERRARYIKECIDKWDKSKTKKLKLPGFEDWLARKKNQFNVGSNTQILGVFNHQGQFFDWGTGEFDYPAVTDKGNATLDQDHIGLYGKGGAILEERGNLKQMLDRIANIAKETGSDGKWHPDYNLLGAKSGRISTPGSNLLAFPVEEKELASSVISGEGHSFIAVDFRSLEPAVQAHLSGDPKLRYAIVDGVGKKPFWKDGVLWIDDVYLMHVSAIKEFNQDLDVDLDLWVEDSEEVKHKNKLLRGMAKGVFLSTVYGAMPPTVRILVFKHTKKLYPLSVIKPVVRSFWQTFSCLFMLKKELTEEVRKNTYLINEFGYPLTFASLGSNNCSTPMHTVLNRMIQSTAAGVMKLFIHMVMEHKPEWMKIVIPDWHDAMTVKVPDDKIEEGKLVILACLDELNKALGWDFELMLSMSVGKTLYDTKN